MLRHGLRLKRRYQQAKAHYRVTRWPLFSPAQYVRLSEWFAEHGRQLPWRDARVSPWTVLVAEMLLRQTSAAHVAKVWLQVIERFPGPQDLLAASTAELQALVAPLGIARVRTGALQATARALVERYSGMVPTSYEDLISLPHVGPYTANAVRCFGYGIAAPVVDVNILRIFDRYFGLGTRTHNPHREPHIWRQADRLMPEQDAAAYQWALLDLAALVCGPNKPKCEKCPIRMGCRSFVEHKRLKQ